MPNGKKLAFYGGSFDPVHLGHLAVASSLTEMFGFDEFTFIPAFHAPHKRRKKPTSALDRFAMLCLATNSMAGMKVSKIEIEVPERPYTLQTLTRLKGEHPDADLFFVMGADSWTDMTTWHEWEKVLTIANHIVVSRPGYKMGVRHVTDDIRERIVDLRGGSSMPHDRDNSESKIYFTHNVNVPISSSEIRQLIRENDVAWRQDLPVEVANYVEKYQIYS